MRQINIYDYIKLFNTDEMSENNYMINVRGTNGSGKSSIPFSFIKSDKDTFELIYEYEGRIRTIATVCPNEKWLFLGSYKNKCGGLDGYRTQVQIADALQLVWKLPYNIIMEGVISSTIFSTYANLFKRMNEDNSRNVIIVTLLPPLEVCLDRIQIRNGGKEIKTELVESKYNTMIKNYEKFKNEGFNCLKLDNSSIGLEETKEWFLHEISQV